MRYVRFCLWMLVLVATVVAVVACKQKVRREPPLLLENGDTGPVADNSRCHVCHINYEQEALAVVHAQADIGCEQCHGPSNAHCSDEDNITPPDIMYPKVKINPFCISCHPKDKIGQLHKSFFAASAANQGYCTDCHGEHSLSYRTRKWDKATGNLVEDDKVRMLTDEMLKQK